MNGSSRDNARVESLLTRYWTDIVRMITWTLDGHKADAEDLAMETFETALECAHKIPDDDADAVVWLFRTARNMIRNFRKSANRHPEQLLTIEEMQAVAGQAPGDLAEDVATQVDVLNLMASLRPTDRQVLHLLFIQAKTTREVAMRLGLREDAVRQKQKRAIERLQEIVDRRDRRVAREAAERAANRLNSGDDHNG